MAGTCGGLLMKTGLTQVNALYTTFCKSNFVSYLCCALADLRCLVRNLFARFQIMVRLLFAGAL